MSYLFGDSTPSPLTSNFIEFLRDSLDFSVHVLLADDRIAQGRSRLVSLRRDADEEIARLRALEAAVASGIGGTSKGEVDSPTAHCAMVILKAVSDAVSAQETGVRSALAVKVAKSDSQEAVERESCFRAFESLLLRHDPPETRTTLRLAIKQGTTSYSGILDGTTPYGLDWSLEVEIPPASAFAHVVRVDKLVPHLDVHAPESGGWLRKEVKLRPQRLERYYITELTIAHESTTVVLRANADGSGPGFELVVKPDAPRIHFVRTGEQAEGVSGEFDIGDGDAEKLLAFHEKVVESTVDLSRARRALVRALLEGVKLQEHERLDEVVNCLIFAMAPITREIARHSLTASELVLKRLLVGDRREEIFVSKSFLLEKLAPLPEPRRALFNPLGLDSSFAYPPSPVMDAEPFRLSTPPARLSGAAASAPPAPPPAPSAPAPASSGYSLTSSSSEVPAHAVPPPVSSRVTAVDEACQDYGDAPSIQVGVGEPSLIVDDLAHDESSRAGE